MKDKMLLRLIVLTITLFISGCTQPKEKTDSPMSQTNEKSNVSTQNALHDAVRSDNIDLVKFLLKQTGDINQKNRYGYTPLHVAVRLNKFEIVKLLIENGANVNTKDTYSDTPLIDSTRNNETEISKLLICSGANRNVFDKNNISTLNYSTKNNNQYISELLRTDDLTQYCTNKSDNIKTNMITTNEKETISTEALTADELLFSIGDLSNLDNVNPIICGKMISDDITKLEIYLKNNQNMIFGPYISILNDENKSWCSTIKEKLPLGTYTVTTKGYDKDNRSKEIEDQFYFQPNNEIFTALNDEFVNDLERWDVALLEDPIIFRIRDMDSSFVKRIGELKDSFKNMLDQIIPRYVDQLLYYKDTIKFVYINAYTSSEYRSAETKEGKYVLNQILSQNRADAILEYIKKSNDPIIKENLDWILSTFKSYGKSSSKLLYKDDGKEDKVASRRVEFEIQLKNK